MKTLISRKLPILAVLFATSCFIGHSAFAQTPYVWVDDKGVKQFSDQPPPASVPKSRIIKFSGKSMDNQDAPSDASSDANKPAKPADSVADKELAYKKHREEVAAQEKKDTEAQKNAAAKAENCKRMRDYKTSLDSGQRIAETDANGNRSYMSDEKRAQETSSLSQNLGDCN
jgi:hypothetical protein